MKTYLAAGVLFAAALAVLVLLPDHLIGARHHMAALDVSATRSAGSVEAPAALVAPHGHGVSDPPSFPTQAATLTISPARTTHRAKHTGSKPRVAHARTARTAPATHTAPAPHPAPTTVATVPTALPAAPTATSPAPTSPPPTPPAPHGHPPAKGPTATATPPPPPPPPPPTTAPTATATSPAPVAAPRVGVTVPAVTTPAVTVPGVTVPAVTIPSITVSTALPGVFNDRIRSNSGRSDDSDHGDHGDHGDHHDRWSGRRH